MAVVLPQGRQQFFDANGDPAVGWKLYTYVPLTSTPKDTYTTHVGNVANANPVVMDARGEAAIYWNGTYDVTLKTAADVTVWGPERLEDTGASLEADLADKADEDLGSGLLGYGRTLAYAAGTVGKTLNDRAVCVTDHPFLADSLGGSDSTAAIQAAIDYAESLISTNAAYNERGVAVYFPPGKYLCNAINIAKSGIALYGAAGPRAATLLSAGDWLFIGDETDTFRVRGVTLKNLTIIATDKATSGVGIELYRTAGMVIDSCQIVDFNVGLETDRASSTRLFGATLFSSSGRTSTASAAIRTSGTDETATTGDAYTPGGGFHLTDVEFDGSSGTVDTTCGVLLRSCDGFYMNNCHFSGYEKSFCCAPAATSTQYVILDVNIVNCYFDDPSAFAASPSCFVLEGTVKQTIARAVGNVTSIYRGIRIVNSLLRGSNEALYCYFMEITDGDSWFDDTTQSLEDLLLNGNTLRQSRNRAIQITGAAAGAFVEPKNIIISNNNFDDNNTTGVTGSASDIAIQAESFTISNNTFGPFSASGADYIILATTTDAGGSDLPNPSALIEGNNLSRCTAPAIEYIRATPGQTGANILIVDNLLPGTGRGVHQDYYVQTSDATTTDIWTYLVTEGTGGHVRAVLEGTITDGTGAKHITYTAEVGFRRNAGGTTLSSGGSTWTAGISWNPDSFGTAPAFDLSTNTLRVRVTGIAATEIDWKVRIDMSLSR